jgi:hypothetical protein
MEIHIEFEGCDPLFDAINSAPFSDTFKGSFIDEILTAPRFRFCSTGVNGLFDGSDMATSETGDLNVQTRLSRTGELMVTALRALTCSSSEKSGHSDDLL